MNTSKNTGQRGEEPIVLKDISELLDHALALEIEAVQRYAELADVMTAHNNREVAQLFRKFSGIEQLHVDQIRQMMNERNLEASSKIKYQWISPEGPESADPGDLHYLMSPHQALTLALINEQRAQDYYTNVAANTEDDEARRLARELSEEEKEHVALVQAWLDKLTKAGTDWDYDDDPPIVQD